MANRIKITPQEFCDVECNWGESIADLGGDSYEKEFEEWFDRKEPELYQQWLSWDVNDGIFIDSYILLEGKYGGRHSPQGFGPCKYDEYMAEFHNECEKANVNIAKLLGRDED